ncbi:MAG: histidinol-phosphate transaminase [Hydrogenothermaceae bacterium]|nr:histidinol-phosphate transaminase [Hydrogenothermaceae bacterium]
MDFLIRLRELKAYKTETTPCKVRLSSNESPFDLSEELKDKILEEIRKINFQKYPDPTARALKEVLADFIEEMDGVVVSPENLVLGNGSDELIHMLISVVGDLDKPVLYPVPTFPMYQVSSDILRRPKVEFFLNEDFDIYISDLDMALYENPQIAFFASPNNPTGNSLNPEAIRYTIDRGIFTVIDEAYIHFSDRKSFLKLALEMDNVVVLRTMSKIGLASIRLGYLVAKKEIAQLLDKARLPFNITYPTQAVAKVVLTEGIEEIKKQIEFVKFERERVLTTLKEIDKVKIYPSDANFYLIKVPDADFFHKNLIRMDVLVRNMSHLPKMENCLRVSVGKREDNNAFIQALKDVVSEL